MNCREVLIDNRLGLHARASAKFVKLASSFTSEIQLSHNDRTVNGKSIMGIMMLAATRGTQLQLCAEGVDQDAAIDALAALIDDNFGEEE